MTPKGNADPQKRRTIRNDKYVNKCEIYYIYFKILFGILFKAKLITQ